MTIHRRAFLSNMLAASVLVAGCVKAAAHSSKDDAPFRKPRDWDSYNGYLRQLADAGRFSGAVLVSRNGERLLESGYGMADRAHRIANAPQTRFCIGSMGKMFTAVAIAQLVEQGRLGFADTIGRHVPGFPPDIADRVTIHQLLTHTSGMGDFFRDFSPSSPPPTTLTGLMADIVKRPLLFPPGSRFGYSNSGFVVLGAILERVTGQPYDEYVRQHVFGPAEMTDTDVRPYVPAKVPNMAHGYALAGQGAPLASPSSVHDVSDQVQDANPSGGAYSTVADMARFAQAVIGHRLLAPSMTQTVLTGKVKADRPGGPPVDTYAYGFSDVRINDVRIVGHDGGTPGYEGQLDIYPGLGFTVVVLTNQDQTMRPAIDRSEALLTQPAA